MKYLENCIELLNELINPQGFDLNTLKAMSLVTNQSRNTAHRRLYRWVLEYQAEQQW